MREFIATMKQADRVSKILPTLMAYITGVPRYQPEIVWSSKSWTHNVFRVYELLFGRRFGIRREMTAQTYQDETGKIITVYQAHTFEATCALVEQHIREALQWKFRMPVKVWIPQFSTVSGFSSPASPFMFAIALDNKSNDGVSSGGTSLSFSYTCTGSNLILLSSPAYDTTLTVNAQTYNSVSLTQFGTANGPDAGNIKINSYFLVGPATGANTLAYTFSGTTNSKVSGTVSYTGAKQTGQLDASANGTGSGGSSITHFTQALSSTQANCMFVHFDRGGNGNTLTADSGTNIVQQPEVIRLGGGMIWDSGTPVVASGSYTLGVTCTAQIFNGGQQASIAPAGATIFPSSTMLMMGVG